MYPNIYMFKKKRIKNILNRIMLLNGAIDIYNSVASTHKRAVLFAWVGSWKEMLAVSDCFSRSFYIYFLL